MSGGFFRGTSADQDTRFSNKQAKLMKSQKFPPELENLVDMSKVKMDVMKPWIANRVTELLGFEDEVLINFIYSLLDVKEVNGKEVQIQLTGFMEKNTGKFMKELWILLLSAQKNESGVPQQFLDAKEEETRKKQAEMDRITIELQKKKEKENRELERELSKKMDGGFGTKGSNVAVEPNSKQMLLKDSSGQPKGEKKTDQRNGVSGRNRVSSSHSADCSPSSPGAGQKSRSVSRSPKARGHQSPRKRPVTSVRGRSPSVTPSPPRRSSYSRRTYRLPSRSISRSPVRCRLHSPVRRRRSSPVQDRSSSPIRRRSPSPTRRRNRSRSPIRRRGSPSPLRRRGSPSPLRRRGSPSPLRRRRSPSPLRRRRSPSPLRRRRSPSPVRRRRSPAVRRRRSPSPFGRRSPSPVHRRSPSPFGRRSPPSHRRSPLSSRHRYQRSSSASPRRSASPVEYMSPVLARKRSSFPRRSPSPDASSSPSPIHHSPPSQMTKRSSKEHLRSPLPSSGERFRNQEKLSPVSHQTSDSLRSPRRAVKDQQHLRNRGPDLSPSRKRSPIRSKSPPLMGNRSASIDRRSPSPFGSPERQRGQIARDVSKSPPRNGREQKPHHHSPQTNKEGAQADHTWEGRDCKSASSHRRSGNEANIAKKKDSLVEVHYKDEHSTEPRSRSNYMESRKKDQEVKRGMTSGLVACPETIDGLKSPAMYKDSQMQDKQLTSLAQVDKRSEEHNHVCLINVKDSDRDHKSVLIEKGDGVNAGGAINSGSEESDKHRPEKKEKRKHKRSHREEVASDDDSYGSEYEDKKEAKKRRKEEKKSRKEEKRRRREERRRRKEERRAEKLKFKDRNEENSSGDDDSGRKNLFPSDDEETHSEQKKLEIELRNKALESLKAKKGISR